MSSRKMEITERILKSAAHIILTKSTLRATAGALGCSKSTVHKDVTVSLRQMDQRLADSVALVLEQNKEERALRGGLATKLKYAKLAHEKTLRS